ncbi:MAG: type VII toxin-antitoxin system MntA family adenylyltransferase antitoxin [Halanaerobium sp.]
MSFSRNKSRAVEVNFVELKKIFSTYNQIKAAYLFGSYAEGRENKKSDLDLGILLDENYNKMIKLDILSKLSENNFDDVDLVILNTASILLKYEIVKHNQLIYCREDFDFSSYFSKTVRFFLDFKPYLKVQREYLKERIING